MREINSESICTETEPGVSEDVDTRLGVGNSNGVESFAIVGDAEDEEEDDKGDEAGEEEYS